MQKIRKFGIVVLVPMVLASCGEYQKVVNKGTAEDQYKMASDLYEQGKYNKAIVLFDKIMPKYQRKPQMERIQYMIAESNHKVKNYDLAAYHYNRFIGNYPNSTKLEEATFMIAKSYYLASPKSSLDQSETQKALASFQTFMDKYPNSEQVDEANKYYEELVKRLEKKSFDIAKNYYHTEYYQAAITAFDTFLEDNFGTSYKEEAMAYKFLASYELGMRSVFVKKEQRLNDAMLAYSRFEKSFPESGYLKDFNKKVENIKEELKLTQDLQAKLDTNGL